MDRRKFIQSAALFGAGLFLPARYFQGDKAPITGHKSGKRRARAVNHLQLVAVPLLDPTLVPKYSENLVIPPVMPSTGTAVAPNGQTVDTYEIAMQQFMQEILPAGYRSPSKVWSYAAVGNLATQNYPAFTIEARYDRPVRVKWVNGLVDDTGAFLPHLFAVDPTLHWANPAGPRDATPVFAGQTPGPYTGPVPMIPHVHGAHVGEESDGYPEAWYLPAANNIPDGYFNVGSFYDRYKAQAADSIGVDWQPGSAVCQYPNHQRATTLWFHDHSLGVTRLNVYAGPAGFYLLRGGPDDLENGELPGPAPKAGDAPGTAYYEIPVAIQDRIFNDDGTLFYPDTRAFFDGPINPADYGVPSIPYVPDSDISPIWNPEYFGNTMVVNGKTWPKLTVEKRRYRLRLLNGCGSRFLILKIAAAADEARPATSALPMWQIGCEGGFLREPVEQSSILMGPAERADVIIDFTDVPAGTSLYLINEAPDEPFGGGDIHVDYEPANLRTTGQVMRFDVVALAEGHTDTSTPPASLTLPEIAAFGPVAKTRQVSLNEMMSMDLFETHSGEPYGPTMAMLGTVDGTTQDGVPLTWADAITESPFAGDVEIWEIHNKTVDAHPIHIHLVMFEVINREDMITHLVRNPEPGENGRKDTVIAYPGEITRIKAHFDRVGRYVWHCHILEHEDNEMMRPYQVLQRLILPMVAR